MAQFRNLQAPITNNKAAQRFQDTQALRARQLAGQASPGGRVAPQQVAAAGAQLTAQTGQANLQEQQRQAQLGRAQSAQQTQTRQMAAQERAFNTSQNLKDKQQKLDQSLFDLSQDAANQEQAMRIEFANNAAQQKYLNEMEMQDWIVQNAKDKQEFNDMMQELEQAHKRKSDMINYAYDLKLKELEQAARKANQEDRQAYRKEIAELKIARENELRRQEREAANRQAMKAAVGTVVGAGLAAGAAALGAPWAAPIIMAGTQAAVQST